jgi:hypothetical protein
LAEAHITLGVVAARNDDLDAALIEGRAALTADRKSLPSLVMHSRELAAELKQRFPGHPRVSEYIEGLRSLSG